MQRDILFQFLYLKFQPKLFQFFKLSEFNICMLSTNYFKISFDSWIFREKWNFLYSKFMEVIFQILFFGIKIWRTPWSKYYGRESDDRNAVLKKCEIHFIFITQTDFSIPLTSKRWFFFHFLELDGRKFQKRKLAFYANPLTLRLELDQPTDFFRLEQKTERFEQWISGFVT